MRESMAAILPILLYGTVLVVAWVEHLWPRRRLEVPTGRRWWVNGTLFAITFALVAGLAPLAAIVTALAADRLGAGLLNAVPRPGAVAFVAGFLLLDVTSYGVHRLFHAVPALWRWHAVHHSDLALDISTSVRHHPFESVVSVSLQGGAILLFGIPAESVAAFHGAAFVAQAFHHANLRLPAGLSRATSWLIVTPDVHEVHHSRVEIDGSTNFGTVLTLWDRLFGTYAAEPVEGRSGLRFGVEELVDPVHHGLTGTLLTPFRLRRMAGARRPTTTPPSSPTAYN